MSDSSSSSRSNSSYDERDSRSDSSNKSRSYSSFDSNKRSHDKRADEKSLTNSSGNTREKTEDSSHEKRDKQKKEREKKNNGVALSISNNEFQERKKGDIVVFFFKETCPYCRELKPNWNKVAKLLPERWAGKNKPPAIVRMDMNKFTAVMKYIGFPTVPCLAMYKTGKPVVFITTKDRMIGNLLSIIENYYKNGQFPLDSSEYKVGNASGQWPREEESKEVKPAPARVSTIEIRKDVGYDQKPKVSSVAANAVKPAPIKQSVVQTAIAAGAQTRPSSSEYKKEDQTKKIEMLEKQILELNSKFDDVQKHVAWQTEQIKQFLQQSQQQQQTESRPDANNQDRVFNKLLETLVRSRNKL